MNKIIIKIINSNKIKYITGHLLRKKNLSGLLFLLNFSNTNMMKDNNYSINHLNISIYLQISLVH